MRTLVVCLGALLMCGSIIAGTVQERFLGQRTFKLYAVVFKITQAPDGLVTDVQLAGAHDIRWEHEHPGVSRRVPIDIPQRYIAAASNRIRATRYALLKHSGKSETSYVPFYYAPALGPRLIVDVHEPE
jgi:hypothetical protein